MLTGVEWGRIFRVEGWACATFWRQGEHGKLDLSLEQLTVQMMEWGLSATVFETSPIAITLLSVFVFASQENLWDVLKNFRSCCHTGIWNLVWLLFGVSRLLAYVEKSFLFGFEMLHGNHICVVMKIDFYLGKDPRAKTSQNLGL